LPERRFPPPWSVDEAAPKLDRRCFIVRDANGPALAYVYWSRRVKARVGTDRGARLGKLLPLVLPLTVFTNAFI
jgi:hypothetical protein